MSKGKTFSFFSRQLLVAFFFAIFLLGMSSSLSAQNKSTGVKGRVVDASTGEALPFVQIVFRGTTIGAVSDWEGRFQLQNESGFDTVDIHMLGYEPSVLVVGKNRMLKNIKIALVPKPTALDPVVIRPAEGSGRYRRRNNPAVELARQVIAHKDQNDIRNQEHYLCDGYEKITLSLDDFHPDYQKHILWKHFPFVEKYVDTSRFDSLPILYISLRETMMKQSYRRSPRRNQTLITATRMEGLNQRLDEEGLAGNLDAMFSPVNIYDGNIELMMNHFVSPLSEAMAVTFYKFYITDTLLMDSLQCIELSFVPAGKQSYGFVGQMYVVNDGSYALHSYKMTVAPQVNLNFVRDLTVVQTFSRDSAGRMIPGRTDTYGRFYLTKKLRKIYAHQTRYCYHYDFESSPDLQPDSLFSPLVTTAKLPNAPKMLRKHWNAQRPLPVSLQETILDSMRYELMRIPAVRRFIRVNEVLFYGYIPTHKERKQSRFDIGPVYNIYSFNSVEGYRLRLGGMTKAQLSPRNFATGYVAYGFSDRRAKFNLSLYHTFDDKRYYYSESPHSYLKLETGYDIVAPGQSYQQFDRDNILMSVYTAHPVLYDAKAELRLRKQWQSNLAVESWLAAHRYTPAGSLTYGRLQASGSVVPVNDYASAQWGGTLRFSPTMSQRDSRRSDESLFYLGQASPVVSLTHVMGWLDGFYYNRTHLSARNRFWLYTLGYFDLRAEGGMVWNQVPLPELFVPNGNATDYLHEGSFNSMWPMEFIVDRYVSLFATYHLKGLILNRLPLIRRLHLREVVSFNMLYGTLSSRNDPAALHEGLYQFPAHTQALGAAPYMEFSVGLENILKVIRIDYVRRINYRNSPTLHDGWRVGLMFTL